MLVTVMNMETQERLYYTCAPKEAVVCAYAQSMDDYNTWDYDKNYNHMIEEGPEIYLCGNFGVFKDGRKI